MNRPAANLLLRTNVTLMRSLRRSKATLLDGNAIAGGVELAFPTPFVGAQSGTRIALFVDTGYVYENVSAFELDKMRGSFGISVTWEAPIGPIVISYAFPFNDQPGDRTEDLQFSFGTTF